MEIMKRITLLALTLGLSLPAGAQEITYALPNTVFTVKVTVQQDQFFAGPYAAYAKPFLNMEADEQDSESCSLVSAEIITRMEADQKNLCVTDADNASLLALSAQGLIALQNKADAPSAQWRFLPPTGVRFDGSITSPTREETRITYKIMQTEDGEQLQIPIEHKAIQAKTLEDKAAEAAEMILTLRRDRLNIVSGNTDASYSGEAMGTAIRELDRMEAEYLKLFRGYTISRTMKASFDIIPDPTAALHRYLAFRLTDSGPVPDGVKGTPYYLELEPEEMVFRADNEKKAKGKDSGIRYRLPVICKVKFTRDGVRLAEIREPVYQLGKEASIITYK